MVFQNCKLQAATLLIGLLWSGATAAASSCLTVSACAYQELNQRAGANETAFYVYLDADSAFNHGYGSGLFASADVSLSSVILNPGCIDAPGSPTGCSIDPNAIDQTRGTVFSIRFPALAAEDFVGLSFQDPLNYTPGDGSNGYNLAPATAVQFDVRSPSGARVQFGVGGCVTGFYQILPTWQTLIIPLNGLYPPPGGSSSPCPPNITNTNILFTVTTNGGQQSAAATVLLDNIQFTPVPARQTAGQQALSLPISTQTFGVIPQVVNPVPSDQANRNVAAIYESSLAIITLLKRGQPGDIANALEIGDTIDYALHHENHGDPVPPGSDGSVGLHSAYMAGDIGSLNAQSTGARSGDVRLAGFSGGTALCGSTGFCLVLDGATGGNNAWAIFGLVAAYFQSGRAYYLTDAETIGAWIINRLQDSAPVGFHGYFVGFNDASSAGLQQPNLGKSTENNGDIFGAFSLLAQIEAAHGNAAVSQQWLAAANTAGNFVASMQIPGGGFYVGTVNVTARGVPGAGNCTTTASPNVGNDVINTCEFLDSDTFTILPMAGAANYSSINWTSNLQHVLNYSVGGATYTQSVTAAGQTFQGFNLVPASAAAGVAFEFTGQVAATCFFLDSLLSATIFQTCGDTYTSQIANAQASAPFGDGLGLVASVLANGSALSPANQCLTTPFQCIPERVGLAATTWAIIADQKFNPMAYPGALFSQSVVTFNAQFVGSASSTTTITLTNSGTAPMTIGQISITGANSPEFGETDTCVLASPLAPAATCTIGITFKPLAAGTRIATLSLLTNAIAGQVALTGQAIPIDDFSLSVSPAGQAVNAGESTSYTVSTSITGGSLQTVTLSAIGLPSGATASFAVNPISAGASTKMTISTVTGTAPGTYTLTVSGAGTEISHANSSTITIQPAFAPSQTSITFATQIVGTTSAAQSVTITNPDASPLPLSILVTGANSGEFMQTNNCPVLLPGSGSCTLTATFTPAGTGPRSAGLQILSAVTTGQMISLTGVGAGACVTISTCAFQELSQRVTSNANSFYVYQDADSGFNHGTPSGVFTLGVSTSAVIINAGCVDLATSLTGCSADPNVIDETRGTVLSIAFPALEPSAFAGVNFQEPQNYAPGDGSAGYNLQPATAVQFDVRSPGGATVQFGVGGCVTGFYQIGPTWQTLSIPLNSLTSPQSLSNPCPPNISDTNILFTLTTNGVQQATASTVLLDNIQFTPVPSRQANATTLPLSTRTYGVMVQQNYPIPSDQVNRNLATTYESALTILALFARGQAQDISYAVSTANALDYALHHDNHGDPIPVENGSAGLHSSYEAGDLALLNPQAPSVGAGHAGDVRLSGFSASASLCGSTQFCLVLDGATGGNNAWAILALAVAFEHTGNPSYLADAEAIGNWVAALADTSGTGFGGYYLGYSDGGAPKELQVGKSTEQNADIFAASNVLAEIESLRGNSALSASWSARAKIAGDFVIQMFDAVNGRFNTGTVDNIFTTGPGIGICPSTIQIKGTDTVNTCDFLDANSAPILAMSSSAAYQNAINWGFPAQYLSTFSQTANTEGGSYQGFDLVTAPAGTGVSWEFTAQAIAVYERGLLPNSSALANMYLQQILAAQKSAPFGDGLGVVAATLQNGDTVAPTSQCLNTPFECISERVGLAATSWAALDDQRINPMNPGSTAVAISVPSLNFGSQQSGTTAPAQPLTLTNSWSVPVTLAISITGTNAGDFSQAGCAAVLAAGASCILSTGFTPTSAGLRSAALSIAQTPSWATLPVVSIVTLSGIGTSVGAGPPSAPILNYPSNGSMGISRTLTLSWEAATGAASYDVYFGTSPSPPLLTNVTTSSYTLVALASNSTYYWYVVAKNSTGSASSPIFSFTTYNSSCSFSASPSAAHISYVGGSVMVNVNAGTGCAWAATSSSSWLTITSGSSGGGDGTISIAANANSGTAQLAYIRFANQSIGIMQGGSPSVQVFNDVPPSDPYFDYVSLMSNYGITVGCQTSPPLYCPIEPVTRAEMAVFIIRGVNLATGASLTYPTTAYFQDVPPSGVTDSEYFGYVQRLAQLAITVGCQTSPALFCPDESIPQGEMAVFVIRAWMLANNVTTLTYPTTPYFTDVPVSDEYFPYVQKMAQLGFWTGCTATTYCENSAVTRDQMAPMILRGMLGAP